MKSSNGFVGGRGFKFDESEKEYKRVKQRMQQATFDPDANVEMDTLDADAVRDELSQLYNTISQPFSD